MENKIDFLDKRSINLLLEGTSNTKHLTCLLLMLDAGLKVSEAISLRYSDFDFKEKLIRPKHKKKEEITRTIPISDRLYQILATYIQKQEPKSTEDFLFPGKLNGHMSRKSINKFCDRIKKKYPEELAKLHPQTLRNTFAAQHLANGTQLVDVKNMLGHQSLATTATYATTSIEEFRKSIHEVTTTSKNNFLTYIKKWFTKPKNTRININNDDLDFTIGRDKELSQINDLLSKNCNTLLLGPIGIGKSHLIKQIKPEGKKVLIIDDCYDIKRTLVQCLVYLYKNDKEQVFNLIYGDYDINKLQQNLQRDSIAKLTEQIIKITTKNEYLMIIDNVDYITPKAIKTIEAFKDHFTILTSTREIPMNKSSFIWNFQIIRINKLNRQDSIKLIHHLSNGIEIEDPNIYRSHIYEQTDGNPRAILELVDRYRKEAVVTTDIIRNIKHTGIKKEYDMSAFIILILGGSTTLRYIAHETGNDRLRFIGGIALLLLITARYFFRATKKRKTFN